jgi:hypothetical protein
VLGNLSTHTTPDVCAWLEKNPHVHFQFTPVGLSWLNQIETWFGVITRQSIRRGTFSSVKVLINEIRDYITHWNTSAKPFVWTRHRQRDPRQGAPHRDQHQETRSTITLSKDGEVTGH